MITIVVFILYILILSIRLTSTIVV